MGYVACQDFGYFIPGHGGVTDRFDCQVVMGLFTFLYQKTFVPQIGDAEAAARRSVLQQQQLLLLQKQHIRDTAGAGNTPAPDTARCAAAAASQQQEPQLSAAGADDPAIEALLQAARSLNSRQLAALQQSLVAITAAKAAAGD